MLAEIILGVLFIVAGVLCGLGALIVIWANAIGGVTNPFAVNLAPALVLGVLAAAGVFGGIAILL